MLCSSRQDHMHHITGLAKHLVELLFDLVVLQLVELFIEDDLAAP